jgi:hypothetical protein
MYLNDEYAAEEENWVDVELCGPVRPYYPEFGRLVKSMRVPNPHAAAQRWSYIRRWAVEHLQAPNVELSVTQQPAQKKPC